MQLNNQFSVSADPAQVWDHLQDVENLVPCMPGAQLLETVDDSSWKGKMQVKLGPVALNFQGVVERTFVDDEQRTMRLRGSGKDQKGKGAATADVEVRVTPGEGETRVTVVQDLRIQGQIAQFGRGMMQDISSQMTDQFASCLERTLLTSGSTVNADQPGTTSPSRPDTAVRQAPSPAPVQGLRLLFGSLARILGRRLRRLLTRSRARDRA